MKHEKGKRRTMSSLASDSEFESSRSVGELSSVDAVESVDMEFESQSGLELDSHESVRAVVVSSLPPHEMVRTPARHKAIN